MTSAKAKTVFRFFVVTAFLVSWSASAWCDEGPAIPSRARKRARASVSGGNVWMSLGFESLDYGETESTTFVNSDADATNTVLGLGGRVDYEDIFFQLDGMFAVGRDEERETWTTLGAVTQTNNLKYGWNRIDSAVGYKLSDWIEPRAGARWSRGKQNRTNFVVRGVPSTLTAEEEIRSYSILLGVGGGSKVSDKLELSYAVEYFIPVDVDVTNTTVSGVTFTDDGGYTIELSGGIDYKFDDSTSVGLMLYGGSMHWDGSDWRPITGGSVKWPENDTDFFGTALRATYRF